MIEDFQNIIQGILQLLPNILIGFGILVLFYFLSVAIRKRIQKRLVDEMDDPLLAKFLSRFSATVVLLGGLLLSLKIMRLEGMAIAILSTAGLGAFVIGFAFKDIGENFLAGIVLAFNRPFRVDDVVELNGHKGTVVNLTLRDTLIKTFDGKDIFIPNALVVKNPVINFTVDGFLRLDFDMKVDVKANLNQVFDIILACAKQQYGILAGNKNPFVAVKEFSSNALILTVYFWINTDDKSISGTTIKNELLRAVLSRFEEEKIYVPGDVIEYKPFKSSDHESHIKKMN